MGYDRVTKPITLPLQQIDMKFEESSVKPTSMCGLDAQETLVCTEETTLANGWKRTVQSSFSGPSQDITEYKIPSDDDKQLIIRSKQKQGTLGPVDMALSDVHGLPVAMADNYTSVWGVPTVVVRGDSVKLMQRLDAMLDKAFGEDISVYALTPTFLGGDTTTLATELKDSDYTAERMSIEWSSIDRNPLSAWQASLLTGAAGAAGLLFVAPTLSLIALGSAVYCAGAVEFLPKIFSQRI